MRDPPARAFSLADAGHRGLQADDGEPRQEQFGLTSQVAGAAFPGDPHREGCARTSDPDYLHFLDFAYGSAREVAYQLLLAVASACSPRGLPVPRSAATAC